MASTFNLKVITPDGIEFDDNINSLEVTTAKGRIGIHAHHVNLIAILRPCLVGIKNKSNQPQTFVTTTGHIFFENNEAKIITQKFIDLKQINIADITKETDQYKNQLKEYEAESLGYKMIQQKIKNNEQLLTLVKK